MADGSYKRGGSFGSNLARSCGSDNSQPCPTTQSSDHSSQNYPSSAAVDGRIEGVGVGAFTHTATSTNPWWMVDFQESRVISVVRVYNRMDCCPERLEGFEIRVGNSVESWNDASVCASEIRAPAASDNFLVTVSCQAEGRYLFIVLPGSSKILSLTEVRVHSDETFCVKCPPHSDSQPGSPSLLNCTCNQVCIVRCLGLCVYGPVFQAV